MRRFVVIGQTATASPDFSLDDLPGSSGRLDVLLRCVRTALLVSHGLRRDTVIYLVLNGGPRAPRSVRIDGRSAEYLRPDERSLAGAMKSMLGWAADEADEADDSNVSTFGTGKRGVSIARGGLDTVIADLGAHTPYLLDEAGADLRATPLDLAAPVFFIGDHLGVDQATRTRLTELGAIALSVGPVSVHADDVIAIVSNELDRAYAL